MQASTNNNVKPFGGKEDDSSYRVASESMSINDKLKVLDMLHRKDLIDLFKEWKPKSSPKRKRAAPLDQRVSITVSDEERFSLENEIKNVEKENGGKISISQYIRDKALSTIDIEQWRSIAEKSLKDLENIYINRKDLEKRRKAILSEIEESEDEEDIVLLEKESNDIQFKLNKIKARNTKRKNRLSGRMTMNEAETVKWRAQRLCISSSDYLRMLLFDLHPASSADEHMNFQAKQRFYISIIDVSENGWGEPPTIYNCSQCAVYVEEINKLKKRIKQLENFS